MRNNAEHLDVCLILFDYARVYDSTIRVGTISINVGKIIGLWGLSQHVWAKSKMCHGQNLANLPMVTVINQGPAPMGYPPGQVPKGPPPGALSDPQHPKP